MNNNTEKKNKKRKRTTNTTREQYEIYLSAMENDYSLRSGTVNSTLGENYLSKKWEELSKKLNVINSGPQLTSDEWKKRFTDWKYATTSKYRKISEHRTSGSQLDLKCNELEKRALFLWGKITVTGNTKITNSEEIDTDFACSDISNNTLESENEEKFEVHYNIKSELDTENENEINNCKSSINIKDSVSEDSKNNICNYETPREPEGLNKNKNSLPSKPKPLSSLTEKLLEINKDSMKTSTEFNSILNKFAENYIKVKREELEFEKAKLRFEITKYKMSNPDFQFDF